MSELAAIREQIKAILQGVPGIGIVHDYERLTTDWTVFLGRFKDADGRINGCTFAREKRVKQQSTMGETEKAHIIAFRRVMGVKDSDATGIIFDDHLEVLADAFDDYETLNGVCRTINPDWGPMADVVGLQIDMIGIHEFGKVLCHYAECRLCVIEANEY